jgi:uncharacterized phage-associated protein
MPYDARAVANLLLDHADSLALRLTNMGVQKVIYFAHGWHLARWDEPLIVQPIEAWKYGPVIHAVWEAFKQARDAPIEGRAMKFDPVRRMLSVATAPFTPEISAFLAAMLCSYGHIDPIELSRMTHRPGGPWSRVWAAPAGQITLGMRISNEAIKTDFLQQASKPVRGCA